MKLLRVDLVDCFLSQSKAKGWGGGWKKINMDNEQAFSAWRERVEYTKRAREGGVG